MSYLEDLSMVVEAGSFETLYEPSPTPPAIIDSIFQHESTTTELPGVSYDETKKLGEGAFSDVFAGTDFLHGMATLAVAVKVFKDHGINAVLMFLQELMVWSHLSHPNVLPLLRSCDTSLYFISPLVIGGNMSTYLKSSHCTLNITLGLLLQVAKGMVYTHSIGILHRDLKPSNILIDCGKALIADWGLATFVGWATPSAGTPRYMAPEVYEGRGGKPADVYAFAMMLFEAFEGTSPFRGLDYRTVQCLVESRVRPHRPYLASDKVWNLIQRAWAQDPDARPTFDEIVNEMEQWIEQETL